MKEKTTLIIVVFLSILFFLIIITYFIFHQKNNQKTQTQTPTISTQQNTINFNNQKDQTVHSPDSTINSSKEVFKRTLTINSSDSKQLTDLIKKLPLETETFSAFYLPLNNQVVFIPKNQAGYLAIDNFLKENGWERIATQYPKLIKITTIDSLNHYQNQEEIFFEQRDKVLKQIPTQTNNNLSPTSSPSQNSLSLLTDLLTIIFQSSSSLNQTSANPSQESTPFPTLFNPTGYLPQPATTSYQSLQNLFNEVGSRVGVPPKILEGVLTIEMPSTFNLTEQQINLYSTPGNVLPNCGPNLCSATGPMQMTIGVDNHGSPVCTDCRLRSCPNAWATYGNAVNIFTQDRHQPNPCNLRDNIYAAAYKLKTDSGANDPLNWTQEQVYRAGTRYYGRCDDSHRYQRLGNRTYCEFLWWYYTK